MRAIVGTCIGVGITTFVVLSVMLLPGQAHATAGVNQEISFEGKVVTSSGLNIPDGTYNMEFKIYTAAGTCNPTTGSGCTLGWTEDWLVNAGHGVTFTSGTFEVNLDDVAANNFSGIDFNTYPLYLSLTVGNTASCTPFSTCSPDTEMKPYIKLTATPYAMNSNLLNGLSATAFGQLSANNTWTGTNLIRLGSATAFQIQDSSNNSVLTVDTSANRVLLGKAGPGGLGGSLAFNNSAGTNTVTLAAQTSNPASSATIFLPVAGATATQCLQSTSGSTTTSTTLQFGACGSSLANSYASGASQTDSTIALDGTRLGIIVKDASSPIGGSLLTVQNNGGTVKYLDISSTAFAIQAGSTLSLLSASGSALTASALGAGQSNFGTSGTGITLIGNATGNTELQGPLYGASDGGVFVGNDTVTATPLLFELNNSSQQGAEVSANCSTTINSGAIYYSAATAANSTTTNEVRGCIDGGWTDIVTGDQLGILLLGVVEDSGLSPGDFTGISNYTKAPCKVTWSGATSVSVAPCTAYSGGRKVVISSAVTISSLGLSGSISFQHICLTGTNGAPQPTTASTSETANVPTWIAAAPVLCLATVKLSTTPAITNIYDTRAFTTSVKEYVDSTTAVAPGWMVIINTAGDNQVTTTSSSGATGVRGVVAVGNSSPIVGVGASVDSIIIISGPAYVKATSATVGQAAQTSTTAGYMASTSTSTKFGTFKDLGQVVGNGNTSACSAFSNCQFSALVDVVLY